MTLRSRCGKNAFEDRKLKVEDRRNKVVNIHATTQLKVVLVKPERFENASRDRGPPERDKADRGAEPGVHQQGYRPAADRLSVRRGLCRARARSRRVAANTYIITPYHVDIEGDLIDELENNGLYF